MKGQGTGWSPTLLYLVADILITAMSKYARMLIDAPGGSSADLRQLEMYVNDSFPSINEGGLRLHNSLNGGELKLPEAANKSNQGFERLLSISGGRLAIEKTIFYYLAPRLIGTPKHYLSTKELPMTIQVTENFGNEQVPLRQLGPDKPHRILGVLTEPADLNAA